MFNQIYIKSSLNCRDNLSSISLELKNGWFWFFYIQTVIQEKNILKLSLWLDMVRLVLTFLNLFKILRKGTLDYLMSLVVLQTAQSASSSHFEPREKFQMYSLVLFLGADQIVGFIVSLISEQWSMDQHAVILVGFAKAYPTKSKFMQNLWSFLVLEVTLNEGIKWLDFKQQFTFKNFFFIVLPLVN